MKIQRVSAALFLFLIFSCTPRHEEKFEVYLDGQIQGQYGSSSLRMIKTIIIHPSREGREVKAYPLVEVLRVAGIDFAKSVQIEDKEGHSVSMGWSAVGHEGIGISLYKARTGGVLLTARDPQWQEKYAQLATIAKISVTKTVKKSGAAAAQEHSIRILSDNAPRKSLTFDEIKNSLKPRIVTTRTGEETSGYPLNEVLRLADLTKGKKIEVRGTRGSGVMDWSEAPSYLLQFNRRGMIKLTKPEVEDTSGEDQTPTKGPKGGKRGGKKKSSAIQGVSEINIIN